MSLVAQTSCDAALAEQVRERADVILVAVRQEDGADRLATLVRYEKSGRIRSTPRCSSRGNASPASTTSAGPVGLEDGHVLADLAEAAERDDSGTSGHRGSLDAGRRLSLARAASPDKRSVRHSLLAYATVAAGLGVTVAGALAAVGRPLTALALLGAAALAAELLEEPDASRVREPVGPGVFRVASGVDLAAVIVLGPLRGALVAGLAALLARLVRGSWRFAAFQASAFALASAAAGYAFALGGGVTGHLALPDDLVPLTVLAIVYLLVSRGLLQLVGGGEVLQPDFAAAAAETGLGAILAIFALDHPWNVLAVVPVALAVNQAQARVRRSRQETLHALETFANIVDERDPYTYRHSIRVAGYVDSLARALGLPYSDIDRLRWAARLHDLGKVAVDAAVLGKTGKLTPAQWGAVWRAPRLSARLLRRFELSAAEARAVEYHRERFDGRGYYGIPPEDQPLAAHFLSRRRQLRRDDERPPVPRRPRAPRRRWPRSSATSARNSTPPSRRRSSPCSGATIRSRR